MIIILLAFIGVIISMAVGSLWYSLKTPMGRIHLRAMGQTDLSPETQQKRQEEMKPHIWKYLLAQAFLALLTSLFIAFIMIEQKGISTKFIYGEVGLVWLCFTVPIVGQSLLWGNWDKNFRWQKFFSDIFSNLVTYFLIIFVFSLII